MEFPNELTALLAAINVSGKEPVWKISASTDQVTVQLTWNKAKEPEASSSKPKPALKKSKPPSTRRRDAKRYDQWVQAKTAAVTSADVIPSTASVDQNHQTEARTSLEGIREITPTKYLGELRGSSLRRTLLSVHSTPGRHAIAIIISTQQTIEASDVGLTLTRDLI
ncbi:unnamed protein product [Mytilus coruscus]|uniref:Uncharacterized protein n=1 Tax=Mytilus coruscus TaxID=42192 RepID=A0A6J8AAG6_MYTCO|nr:unnamed protein product [Mytilus coruscus]